MSDNLTPEYLQDAAQLLTATGFATSQTWYHGTASGLVDSILKQGLKQSGDTESNQRTKGAMTTIGGSYKESKNPVFLTQSKELAFFWATVASNSRNKLFANNETPAVLAITLPIEVNDKVKPDVGAAALLMAGDCDYFDALNKIYQDHQLDAPQIDPIKADRMEYLNLLGMAYCNQSIASEHITILKP